MVHLHDINIEILACILHYAIGLTPNTISEWIPKLKLLHVCSLWTEIAKPLVFNDGFIELKLTPYRRFGPFFKAVSKVRHITNLDIITGRDYHMHVQTLFIWVVDNISYSNFAKHTLGLLQPEKYEWISVQKLKIDLKQGYIGSEFQYEYNVPPINIEAFVENICVCLPNIDHLSIEETTIIRATLSTAMLNRYVQRLRYISILSPVDFRINSLCEDLTVLSVDLETLDSPFYLPYLRAAQLQILELNGVPPQFSWAEFYDADGPDITFSNLKKLSMEYSYPDSIYKNIFDKSARSDSRCTYYRLHFPKLEDLTIIDCPPDSELLHCFKYFQCLKTAKLGNRVGLLEPIIYNGLEVKERLTLHVYNVDTIDKDCFYKTTNHIFGQPNKVDNMRLSFRTNLEISDLRYIEWPNLHRLSIQNSWDVDLYICLLARLPKLSIAAIAEPFLVMPGLLSRIGRTDGFLQSLDARHKPTNIYDQKELKKYAKTQNKTAARDREQFLKWVVSCVSPFNDSKLEYLVLHHDHLELNSTMALIVCYIIIRFPQLKKVFIDDELKAVKQIVEKLEPYFPWLKNLEIRYFDRYFLHSIAKRNDLATY